MTLADVRRRADSAANKVAKWRRAFAMWQVSDDGFNAIADHRELSILMRVELNALQGMLLERGLITENELCEALEREAALLDKAYAKRFPGITSDVDGLVINPAVVQEHGTMDGWN